MKLTDEELIAAIEAEEAVALDSQSGELQQERSEALQMYRGELPNDAVAEGRSAIVDRGVMDTIQWIMPSLVRIYQGGDEIGKFEPIGPEDEYAADCETEICNWYLTAKNDFYSHLVATLTDALLLKNGYMLGYWATKKDVVTETYTGMADEEAAMLMQDQDVTVVEHTEYPDPVGTVDPMSGMVTPATLHDVKVERKKADEFVAVESVPPDEIVVSRRHRWTSLADADFVQWRRRATIGQLRAEGFDIPDDVQEHSFANYGEEATERERYVDQYEWNDATPDVTRKVVLFKDTYIRMDLRGKGTQQLWRVAYVDGMRKPVLKEEADCVPFAAFSPLIYPHSHIGTSVFDLIADLSVIKTLLQRNLIDSVFLQTNGMLGVDVNKVNVDDALVRGPGRLIRTDGPAGDALFPIVTADAGPAILQSLEYVDQTGERRTGVTRYSAGLDADSLNKTATGVTALQSAADQRIELIARTLAGGFRDLFLIIHTLASKHSTKPVQIKLKGQWQAVDPRQWAKRTDFSISVGLGTGSPETQLMKLTQIGMAMKEATPLGLAGPQEFYNWFVEFLKAAGYRNPSKFVIEPEKDPQTGKAKPPPPQKDPLVQAEEVKAQATLQGKQMDGQIKGQELQQKEQLERERLAAEMELERYKAQLQLELEKYKADIKAQTEMQSAHIQAQIKDRDGERQAQVESRKAETNAETQKETAKITARAAGVDLDGTEKVQQVVGPIVQELRGLVSEMSRALTAEREVVRDPKSGRAVGTRVRMA
jgi:hypothetical protein